MPARGVLPVVLVIVLAGCSQGDVGRDGIPEPVLPRLAAAGTETLGDAPLVWQGATLTGRDFATGPGQHTVSPCTRDSCERIPFRLDAPASYWDAHPGFVEVSIEWEHQDADYRSVDADALPMGHYLGLPNLFMHVRVLDAKGALVKEGVESFHYASLALLEDPPPGDYIAEVQAWWGTGAYTGILQVERRAEPFAGEALPDLTVLPPTHLTLEHPIGREGPDPVVPLGRKGCDPDEAAEGGAVRCLRFATAFGNHGPGRLEMHLSPEAYRSAIVAEGQWTQHVLDGDGTLSRTHPASPASYHKVHGHYHIEGLDVSTVYAYDMERGVRGEAVGEGHKTGFCPVDSALLDPTGLGTTLPVAYAGCCYMWGFCQLDMLSEPDLRIALSAGWYDVYPWWRADQYVDIAGALDGTYELETCANPDGHMLELRGDNNCASTFFRLSGDDIHVLAGHP